MLVEWFKRRSVLHYFLFNDYDVIEALALSFWRE